MFEVEGDTSLITLPFLNATGEGRDLERGREAVLGSIVILSIFVILHSFQTYEKKGISVNLGGKYFTDIGDSSVNSNAKNISK